jgi:hypothetical protein
MWRQFHLDDPAATHRKLRCVEIGEKLTSGALKAQQRVPSVNVEACEERRHPRPCPPREPMTVPPASMSFISSRSLAVVFQLRIVMCW